MKQKLFLTSVLILTSVFCFAQNSIDKINFAKSAADNSALLKALDASMKFVPEKSVKVNDITFKSGNMYIDAFETTNAFYNAFLKDLKDNSLNDLFEQCKVCNSKWLELSEAYETASKYYHIDTKYNDYPVVNISKQAAETFCAWLTKLYAAYSASKYKNTEFFLPDEALWIVASNAGIENAVYPWEGKFLRNKKGEYMANFKVAGEENIRINKAGNIEILDNNVLYQTIFAPVKTYSPNVLGLYQMSGNAAEMTSDGKIKGGSWHSYGYYMQISAEDEPGELPNPFTGFRVAMKIK